MNEELGEYKSEVEGQILARMEWERDLVFTGTTRRGYDIDFDSANEWGCMPLEGLVLSLAGCLAIDMVAILTKMRSAPEAYSMKIRAQRSTTPPQRLLGVDLELHLSGDLDPKKVQRAMDLSADKYCSVRHSLREDIEIRTSFVIEPS